MGYIDKNLMGSEEVVYTAKIHWFIFVPPLIFLFAGIWLMGSGVGATEPGSGGGFVVFGVTFVIVSIAGFISALITRATTELGITTKRVIAKVGLIRRNTIELNHSKVESFVVDQSVFGRIFDFGTLVIQGTGGGKTPIKGIDSPLKFRQEAMEIIDKSGG